MSRWHSYLSSAGKIISAYRTPQPFSLFLRNFFSQNPKMGAGDRRWISQLCYSYFRAARGFTTPFSEDHLVTAHWLVGNSHSQLLEHLRPEMNSDITADLETKIARLESSENFQLENIHPFNDLLSTGIDTRAFCISHLQQPDLFLRCRPGKREKVIGLLRAAGISCTEETTHALRLPNGTRVEALLSLDTDAVVQDLSSQATLSHLQSHFHPATSFAAWDCCAASGGKSLLLYDSYPDVALTVSDVRENILLNLRKRFERAGIVQYKAFVADLSKGIAAESMYDVIIADLPCTGSGTWSRTPENLPAFEQSQIKYYRDLQKKISANACRALKQGGYFVYITCSVYREENESIVEHLVQQGLSLIEMQVIDGYTRKADTMFTALLRRS